MFCCKLLEVKVFFRGIGEGQGPGQGQRAVGATVQEGFRLEHTSYTSFRSLGLGSQRFGFGVPKYRFLFAVSVGGASLSS